MVKAIGFDFRRLDILGFVDTGEPTCHKTTELAVLERLTKDSVPPYEGATRILDSGEEVDIDWSTGMCVRFRPNFLINELFEGVSTFDVSDFGISEHLVVSSGGRAVGYNQHCYKLLDGDIVILLGREARNSGRDKKKWCVTAQYSDGEFCYPATIIAGVDPICWR